MAKATDTGDCGCQGSDHQRREQVLAGQVLGSDWKDIVEAVVMKDAAEQARARLKAQEHCDDDGDVVVETRLTLYIAFPRDAESISDAGVVTCACSISADGVICKCLGACNIDVCCPGSPPVAVTE